MNRIGLETLLVKETRRFLKVRARRWRSRW